MTSLRRLPLEGFRRAGFGLASASFGLLLASSASASEGMAWLKIPQGARSVAMGTAVSGIQGGAESLWYTPGALGRLKSADLTVSRQAWLGKTRDDFIALAIPLGFGGVGAFGNLVSQDDIYRDALGNEGPKFSNGAMAGGLSLGFKLGFMSAGVTGKLLQERYESKQSSGYASDLGAQAVLGPWLRLGGAVQNIGAWSGSSSLGSVELPLTYRGGVAIVQAWDGLTLSLEGRALPISQESSFMAGGEYALDRAFWGAALRVGYEGSATRAGGLGGLALGAGARLQNLKLDFTYTPYGGLGDPYRMTLGWEFGGSGAAITAPPKRDSVGAIPAAPAAPQGGTLELRLAAARTLMQQERFDEAAEAYRLLSLDYPANAKPYEGLARAYQRLGRRKEAIEAMTEKLAREPNAAQQAWLDQYKGDVE